MKKLFLLTLTLFLFGCDPVEQDTRLICDCDYVFVRSDMKKSECDSAVESMNNNSLVFNESKNKFAFDGRNYNGPSVNLRFSTDEITLSYQSDITQEVLIFDRVSLVLSESSQINNPIGTANKLNTNHLILLKSDT